jgi:3-hydroxyisobutyrate dehydrogenase
MGSEVKSVAVLGTGIMGAGIARNLAEAGLDVAAWNRTKEKADPLAEHGVSVEADAGDAVRGRDAVITMLSDADAVTAVAEETIAGFADGAIWMQASTVGHEATARHAALAGEHQVAFADAPVLGTRKPAEDGQLIVLASGEDADLDALSPVFDAIGSKTVRLGDAGASSRMKIVLNSWLLALTAALAETVSLAEALDLDAAEFLGIIEGGPIDAGYAQLKGKAMIERDFATSFPLYLALKDSRLVAAAAEGADLELALGDAILGRFEAALEQGHGDEDMAAVYNAISARDDERPAAEA